MPLDLAVFADKLRRYRAQFETSLEQISSATGIAVESLAAFEGGGREPTGDEVLILADYFKCDYRFFVSNERLAPFEQTEALFRKFGNDLSTADRWAIQEFLFLCACEAFLEQELQRPQPRTFTFTKRGTFFKGHGEEAALRLRRHLGYLAGQIPVDVFEDFRAIGVRVFRRQLQNSKISGLYLKHPAAGKCVLVNYFEDVYRQRFTAAHEAGHSILDDDEDFVVSFEHWDHANLVEVRANTFAAHFLLPPEYVKQLTAIAWTPASIVDAARRFRVNVDTLVIALRRDGLIDDANAKNLKGAKVPPSDKVDPELPASMSEAARARKLNLLRRGLSTRYAQLCFQAYERDLISVGRLAEMMLADERELLEIGAAYGWSAKHGS